MRKGIRLQEVRIAKNGSMLVLDQDGNSVKVSRSQRNLLASYKKNPDYVNDIITSFNRNDILADDFFVTKDGKVVFRLTCFKLDQIMQDNT